MLFRTNHRSVSAKKADLSKIKDAAPSEHAQGTITCQASADAVCFMTLHAAKSVTVSHRE